MAWGLRPTGIQMTAKGATLPYRLTGEWDASNARIYIQASLPATLGSWYRTDYKITGMGGGIWDVDAEYGPKDQKEPEVGDYKWTFDTTGATIKVKQAIEHIQSYVAAGGTVIPHYGAIGVKDDFEVEGIDVPGRAFKWTESWPLPMASYGFLFATVLGELTGKCNNAYFRGFPAYTVRFDGATGGWEAKSADTALVTYNYNFAVCPSVTGMTIGEITGIDKVGWDVWSIYYEPHDDSGSSKTIPKPRQVDIDRVLTAWNFSMLGIGTGMLS